MCNCSHKSRPFSISVFNCRVTPPSFSLCLPPSLFPYTEPRFPLSPGSPTPKSGLMQEMQEDGMGRTSIADVLKEKRTRIGESGAWLVVSQNDSVYAAIEKARFGSFLYNTMFVYAKADVRERV